VESSSARRFVARLHSDFSRSLPKRFVPGPESFPWIGWNVVAAIEDSGTPSPSSRRARGCSGFSLIETIIAAAMILSALLVVASSIVRSKVARVESEQQMAANAALDEAVATLETLGITSAYQNFAPNSSGAAFPAKGSGPGPAIVADGLKDAATPDNPAQVAIQFFTDETSKLPEYGLPRDLDGDGAVDNKNVATLGPDGELEARILPYLLKVTFRGPGGGAITATRRGVLTHVR
jgi:type II secretory pathway pseudopilin PulG